MHIKPFTLAGSALVTVLFCTNLVMAENTAAPAVAASPPLLELPAAPAKPSPPIAPAPTTAPAVLPSTPATAIPPTGTPAVSGTPPVASTAPSAIAATIVTPPVLPGTLAIPAQSDSPTPPSIPPMPAAPTPPPLPAASAAPPATPEKKYERQPFTPKLLTIDPATKVQVLETPIMISPDFSLMFSEKDMVDVIVPSLELYDKSSHPEEPGNPTGSNPANGDGLTDLIESLRVKGDSKQTTQQKEAQLPNLYLGSILYYSPGNWSVWINGKKIVNRLNNENNVLYVRQVNSSGVTLVWHPSTFKEMRNKYWNDRNQPPSPGITINDQAGTLTFTLHPNQTLISRTLQLREGLIVAVEDAIPASASGAAEPGGAVKPATPTISVSPPVPPHTNRFK